ncbi:MAG: prepilin-type N-terminal cleavage/methylation domain [Armatimonadetes bacterium]|jgi:prepilin-type N-terminal cleavage/methylation domain-containing protein|nr:prepilin-type N-terminal cleavage/methylation domain [Armatimonadota bacterium]
MNPFALNRRHLRGFTLIELLAVIAIIALLSAILFPVMATVRKNAREGACMSNMHSIIQAMRMYKDDWRVYPDALYGIDYGSGAGSRLFPDYVKDEKVFNCPESPARMNDRAVVSVVDPMTGSPVQGVDPATGLVAPYGLFEFSSYDFQYRPNKDKSGLRELHYHRKWSVGGPGITDNPRQLVYKEPPDSTVVSWCIYHTDMDAAGNPAANRLGLVAFLSGRVQKIDAAKLSGWPGADGGYPWLVSPKP